MYRVPVPRLRPNHKLQNSQRIGKKVPVQTLSSLINFFFHATGTTRVPSLKKKIMVILGVCYFLFVLLGGGLCCCFFPWYSLLRPYNTFAHIHTDTLITSRVGGCRLDLPPTSSLKLPSHTTPRLLPFRHYSHSLCTLHLLLPSFTTSWYYVSFFLSFLF